MPPYTLPVVRSQRDVPTLVSRRRSPGPRLRPVDRGPGCRPWLNCSLVLLLPLAIVVGIFGGIFLVAWQSGRLNVLILGVDRRPGETAPVRTDTLILGTFYPGLPQAALLSIPRDLWVNIPGYGTNRINTANYFGDLSQEDYGPVLAMQTVAGTFGVPVHGYIRLDFSGFTNLVDALGGVTIDVPETIIDSNYPTPDYGTTTITIPAGRQHMDGETALIYARTRHTDSDFGRSRRQQQILRALLTTALRPATWPRLPAAWIVARTTLETNLTETDLATILLASLLVGPDRLQTAVINQEMTTPYVTGQGAQVLLPRWEAIQPLLAAMFRPELE